jgi:hypothetical protein
MLQGGLARNSPIRIILQQLVEQIRRIRSAQLFQRIMVRQWRLSPLRKICIVVWQSQDSRPLVRGGGASALEYFEQLINVTATRKEGHARRHFGKDAADGPDIDGGAVPVRPQQEFRGSVPQGDDFKGVGAVGNGRQAGKTEISEFERAAVSGNEELNVLLYCWGWG